MSSKSRPIPSDVYDSWSEDLMTDPLQMYEDFRAKCPVAHSKQHGGFAFTVTYKEAKRVLSEFTTFSSAEGALLPPRPERSYPFEMDPPAHTHYRRMLHHAFSHERVSKERGKLEGIVDDLIDRFIEQGEADLADDLIRPALPPFVMPLIGVPLEDLGRMRMWLDKLLRQRVSDPEGAVAASVEIMMYLSDLVSSRRHGPVQEDALGAMISSKINNEPVPDRHIAGTVLALLLGGLDTTTSVTLDALLFLSKNKELAQHLLDGSIKWDIAIEEFTRFSTPSVAVMRTVTRNTKLGSVDLEPSERVLALLQAANRDPEVFDRPNECLLDRADNPHIAFGAGAHVCIGRFLARLEIEVFLKAVITRIPDFQTPASFCPTYWTTSTRQMRNLPVTFAPRTQKGQSDKGSESIPPVA